MGISSRNLKLFALLFVAGLVATYFLYIGGPVRPPAAPHKAIQDPDLLGGEQVSAPAKPPLPKKIEQKKEVALRGNAAPSKPATSPEAREPTTRLAAVTPSEKNRQDFDRWLAEAKDPMKPMTPGLAFHERMVSEASDPNWAPDTINTLQNFFSDAVAMAGSDSGIDILKTDCRTSFCEISLVQPADKAEMDNPSSIQRIARKMQDQPWYSGFLQAQTQFHYTDDGNALMMMQFIRASGTPANPAR